MTPSQRRPFAFFIILVVGFLFSHSGHATSAKMTCFQFPTEAVHSKVKQAIVALRADDFSTGQTSMFSVTANSGESSTAPFTCKFTNGKRECSNDDGAGDFSLTVKKSVPVLSFSYINLGIASAATQARSTASAAAPTSEVEVDEPEIDEKFAVFDEKSAAKDQDALEEDSQTPSNGENPEHLKQVIINGTPVDCPEGTQLEPTPSKKS